MSGRLPRTKADWDAAIAETDTLSLEDARASAKVWRTYARNMAPDTEEEAIRREAAADAARPPPSSGWLTRMFGGGK